MLGEYNNLAATVELLKSRVNKFSIYGAMIAAVTIILATMFSSHQQFNEITLNSMILTQKENMVLWLLDAMPFIFAIWGQYTGSLMAYEAGIMVLDQTNQLRVETSTLEQKAQHDTTHDPVTDLPNRILFNDRLEQAVVSGQREKTRLAILILELSNFKEVNNTLGHYNGDRLLKKVAIRLRNVLRESDTIARHGGDEFAALLPKVESRENALAIAEKLITAMEAPFDIEGLTLGIHLKIGIALFPEHSRDADTLQQRANVALHSAKGSQTHIVVYDPQQDQYSPQRLTLMGELRQAINSDELFLYYQPKLDLATNRIHSVEALIRWQHPKHGFLGPDEFIPLAERTGLIHPLTVWILDTAIRRIKQWHEAGYNISVAINLSALLLIDQELPELIAGKLAYYQIPVDKLRLEITESAIIVDPERALEILERIHKMGVHISIDDFGTGYSSLAYLSKLTINEIKIDRSFVMLMANNKRDEKIVHATINLAHNLDLSVVAEGVEDPQTLERLRQLGCDSAQGFFIGCPAPADAFIDWLRQSDWFS
jgi:diguanylate cyclase (GGDEF)-like protein